MPRSSRGRMLSPPRTKNTDKRVPLVATYHPGLPNLPSIIKNNFPVLHASNHLKKAIPERPFVAYRRPKNLRDLLIISKLKPDFFEPARGSSPCGSKRCLTCNHIHTDTTIRSTTTGKIFHVRTTATCKTKNLIYLIQCKKCQK